MWFEGRFHDQRGRAVPSRWRSIRRIADSDGQPTPPEILHGGGIWADVNAALLIESSTIVTNLGGRGVRGQDGAQQVVNTILWVNVPSDVSNLTAAAFSHSRADALTAGVDGNITDEPRLIDPANGDYGLQTVHTQFDEFGNRSKHPFTSPCVDAGTNRDWMAEATDRRGLPRLSRGLMEPGQPVRADMGAYEVSVPANATLILIK